MTRFLARLFRTLNAKLLRFSSALIHRPLKLVYGLSAWCFRSGWGRSQPRQVIDNFDGNAKLLIDPSRNMGASIFWTGFHEFRELLFLSRWLKANMVVVDAGANIGLFSVFASRRIANGQVIAFEPVPTLTEWLVTNIKLNDLGNIIVEPCGLSDTEGTFPIYEIDSTNEGLSTLYPGSLKQSRATDVPVNKLDNFITSKGLKQLDFIKMDIEGGELPALRGAVLTIRTFRPAVMVEINQSTYTSAGYTPGDVYDFFSTLNYRPHTITKNGELKPERERSAFQNVVFLPA